MLKSTLTAMALCALALTAPTFAKDLEIPDDNPAIELKSPSKWAVDELDHGYRLDSDDDVATMFFEVVSAKKSDSLIDENFAWLKENGVTVDLKSQEEKEFESNGIKWHRLSWKGNSKEFGPAVIGFLFADLPRERIISVTYWLTKEGLEAQLENINSTLESVKMVK